jgi:hypothetical protein
VQHLRWFAGAALAAYVAFPIECLAFKPKTHLDLALQSIVEIDTCKVTIDGVARDVDDEICAAIRQNKGDYLAGVIGPDAFPDLLFGQSYIHPDTRCQYEADPNGQCSDVANTTWALD